MQNPETKRFHSTEAKQTKVELWHHHGSGLRAQSSSEPGECRQRLMDDDVLLLCVDGWDSSHGFCGWTVLGG